MYLHIKDIVMLQLCHIPKFGEQIKICQNWLQDYDAVLLAL